MRGDPPSARDSGNGTVWEEYADVAFVVANSLILLVTSVVGIAANIFVVLAVYRQKSLQTSNNALVVNLAVVDFLRCLIDCPVLLTIVTTVHRRGRVHDVICDAQIASFSFSCCIQLLTLACISAERHQAIAQPFKAGQRKTRITVLIPLTWILAVLVAALCLVYLRDSPVNLRCRGRHREQPPSYDTFGLYMLFPLWAACFGVIISFYARIFALVRSHNRRIFDKGTLFSKKDTTEDKQKKEETKLVENTKVETLRVNIAPAEPDASRKNSSTSLQAPAKAPQCVSINSESKKEFADGVQISHLEPPQPPPSVRAEEKRPPSEELLMPCASNGNTQEVSERLKTTERRSRDTGGPPVPSPAPPTLDTTTTPPSASLTAPKQGTGDGGQTPPAAAAAAPAQAASSPPVAASNVPVTVTVKPPAEADGAVCMMPSKAGKERASKKKESKMAKRAGYIIVTFLLFWLPLISTILANVVGQKYNKAQVSLIQDMEVLSVSVACITSLSDPIIYAAVNPQFRSEFYRLTNRVNSIFSKKA